MILNHTLDSATAHLLDWHSTLSTNKQTTVNNQLKSPVGIMVARTFIILEPTINSALTMFSIIQIWTAVER